MGNSLLMRNLLAGWPRDRLAQIYSGGDNHDDGFCGSYYEISPGDRRFGSLFFRLKHAYSKDSSGYHPIGGEPTKLNVIPPRHRLRSIAGRFLMESGLYELIFKFRASSRLVHWAREISPDVILAQGYNLSFVWIPLILKRLLHKPIVYYASDDWPSYLYESRRGVLCVTAPFMRRIVARCASRLIGSAELLFSFNMMMSDEYKRRYGKTSVPLMYCDDPLRFQTAKPIKLQAPPVRSVIAAGGFDSSRWPLLFDLDEACARLNRLGIRARGVVFVTSMTQEGRKLIKSLRYLEMREDPGHEMLPSYLKGADLLYLAETFDEEFARKYRLSISTKAHLFMFSERPILVYGHSNAGLVKYARCDAWAKVVEHRDVDELSAGLLEILSDPSLQQRLVRQAHTVAMKNHDSARVRQLFTASVTKICVS